MVGRQSDGVLNTLAVYRPTERIELTLKGTEWDIGEEFKDYLAPCNAIPGRQH